MKIIFQIIIVVFLFGSMFGCAAHHHAVPCPNFHKNTGWSYQPIQNQKVKEVKKAIHKKDYNSIIEILLRPTVPSN